MGKAGKAGARGRLKEGKASVPSERSTRFCGKFAIPSKHSRPFAGNSPFWANTPARLHRKSAVSGGRPVCFCGKSAVSSGRFRPPSQKIWLAGMAQSTFRNSGALHSSRHTRPPSWRKSSKNAGYDFSTASAPVMRTGWPKLCLQKFNPPARFTAQSARALRAGESRRRTRGTTSPPPLRRRCAPGQPPRWPQWPRP